MVAVKSKKLTKLELYWYILGSSLGSGLFVLLPIAIGFTGRSVVLAIVCAGTMHLVNGMYGLTMASMFPLRGGNYSQVSYLIPPLFSGVYGLIWLISALTMAAYATGAISYTASLIPAIAPYAKALAVAIITAFFALNYFGAKFGAKFQRVMTITLLAALGLFIAWGLPKVDVGGFATQGNFFMGGLPGFSAAIAMCMWATDGVTTTATALTSEMERPTKDVPKAMLFGTALVVLISVLITFVASGALPIEEVANQDLTVVAGHIFPKGLYVVFVLCGAVLALITSLLGSITTFRYPFEQLAEEGWLPPVFKKRTANGWPVVGMVTMYILVLIPVLFGISFDKVVSYTSFPGTFIVLCANLRAMSLPKQYPELWKRSIFHMPRPLYYVLCLLGATGCGYLAYCYCADMTLRDVVMMVGLTALMFAYSFFFLKTKRVDVAYLQAQKDEIAEEVLAYERTIEDSGK